jgi:hypothetical protein
MKELPKMSDSLFEITAALLKKKQPRTFEQQMRILMHAEEIPQVSTYREARAHKAQFARLARIKYLQEIKAAEASD